jgi:two-component system response regulator FixJ
VPETVYVVDDDAAVREALGMLFDSAGLRVVMCTGAEDFLQQFNPGRPSCVVLDLQMPGIGGLELQQMLSARGLQPPIIFLTGHGDVPAAVQALQQGAVDFIEKPVRDTEGLLERVRAAIHQDRQVHRQAADRAGFEKRLASLTPREREVMILVAAGSANKVVAAELGISERTVELHRGRLLHKLGVRSAVELARLLPRMGPQDN